MIEPFVDAAWLSEHRDDVVLADVRWYMGGPRGRDAYDEGHLQGAVFVDFDRWLTDEPTATDGRHPLPDPTVFADGMSVLGISDGDTVVAYDDAGGVVAARLVWMLRATGHEAAVLDGALAELQGPLDRAVPARGQGRFTARTWPQERLADVEDAIDPRNVVLDARPRERYAGAPDDLDPRAGHIPGARSLPCRENVDGEGRLLPVEVLRERLETIGAAGGSGVVSTCGSGVTACHTLLLLEHVGLGEGRLFPGSWSAYSRDHARPVATGDEPG